jgi:hypothetical protein
VTCSRASTARAAASAPSIHRPFSSLVSDAVGDILNLDTRLVRTLHPLMLKPAARNEGGGRTTFSLPRSVRYYDEWYQGAVARAMKQPEAFAHAVYSNVPRAFFFLVPVFALLFLAARSGPYVTGWGAAALGLGLVGWLLAYLPVALRRVYGGSRLMTGLELAALGTMDVLPVLFAVVPVIFAVALLQS